MSFFFLLSSSPETTVLYSDKYFQTGICQVVTDSKEIVTQINERQVYSFSTETAILSQKSFSRSPNTAIPSVEVVVTAVSVTAVTNLSVWVDKSVISLIRRVFIFVDQFKTAIRRLITPSYNASSPICSNAISEEILTSTITGLYTPNVSVLMPVITKIANFFIFEWDTYTKINSFTEFNNYTSTKIFERLTFDVITQTFIYTPGGINVDVKTAIFGSELDFIKETVTSITPVIEISLEFSTVIYEKDTNLVIVREVWPA